MRGIIVIVLATITALAFISFAPAAARAQATRITMAYPSFTTADSADFVLDGNDKSATPTAFKAYVPSSSELLRLTDARAYLSGSAFAAQPVALPADRSFSAAFTFHIHEYSWQYADGLLFVLQPRTSTPKTIGGTMGFLGQPGSQPGSLAIEFDTYQNASYDSGAPVYDPNNNHIGVDLNGSAQSVVTATPPGNVKLNVADGNPWNVWIDYDGGSDLLEVRMAQTWARPDAATLSYTVDLEHVLGQNVYAGFSSSTGGWFSAHDITAFYLENSHVAGGLNPAGVTYVSDGDNTAPQAAADTYTRDADGALSPADGVLANDSDAQGDPLTAELAAGPAHAESFHLSADGSFTYVPAPGFAGTDGFTYTANDGRAGSSETQVTIEVLAPAPPLDGAPPLIAGLPGDTVLEATSADGAELSFSGSATDDTDGAVPVRFSLNGTPISSPYTFPLGDSLVAATSTDAAGNTAEASFVVRVVDTTAPQLAGVPAGIAVRATSGSGALLPVDGASATDAVDPAPQLSYSAQGQALSSPWQFPLGTTTVTVTATDAGGNAASASYPVSVTYDISGGILQPVNGTGPRSSFKSGSTIPVKFQLPWSGGYISDAVARFSYAKLATTSGEAGATDAPSSGSLFRYDATGNQYIYNWSTKGVAAGDYRIVVTLNGGQTLTATVAIK